MNTSLHDYGQISRRVLAALHNRELLKASAFAAYVEAATGAPLTESQVCNYIRGSAHFPAELLIHLAAFVGPDHADKVWSPFLVGSGYELRREGGPVVALDGERPGATDPGLRAVRT